MREDINWNHLEHHSMDEILEDEVLWTEVWYPGWESDNPNPVCVKECGVYVDEVTGQETTPAEKKVVKRGTEYKDN
jgi:hypothetical protein